MSVGSPQIHPGPSDHDLEDSYVFKVKALFKPRPLVRQASVQHHLLTASTLSSTTGATDPRTSAASYHRHNPSAASNRDQGLVVPPVPHEERKKRIDELADNLDAGALRELMERDRRRKELKRQIQQEKKEKKMQERAAAERRKQRRKRQKQQKQQQKQHSHEQQQQPEQQHQTPEPEQQQSDERASNR
ncbi:hypothetical protein KEM52_002776, partial [Ascosphaera acerosa]